MSDIKYCPISPVQPDGTLTTCGQDHCAWWCEAVARCAVAVPGWLAGQDKARYKERRAARQSNVPEYKDPRVIKPAQSGEPWWTQGTAEEAEGTRGYPYQDGGP